MDLVKELKKQAEDIMKDEKKKEQAGDAVEGALKGYDQNNDRYLEGEIPLDI